MVKNEKESLTTNISKGASSVAEDDSLFALKSTDTEKFCNKGVCINNIPQAKTRVEDHYVILTSQESVMF